MTQAEIRGRHVREHHEHGRQASPSVGWEPLVGHVGEGGPHIEVLHARGVFGFRWYAQYLLPTELDRKEITVRLDGSDADAKRKLNRAENLRAIPRSSPDFARLYARRGDAESVNRALEDTLYLNRAHSEGHLRQTADLLGFALMVNSLTLARHRTREAVRTAA
jgi:hypothetical protein